MNIVHLKTFVAVAELRHFARAASVCHLSQPAVSHQIALLEQEIGARLFNRTARRVSLTVAGEVLLEEARRVLAAVDRARERMQAVTSGAVGRIRLGATPTPGLYLLPPLLAEYRLRHPSFDLHFEIDAVDQIAERVARNELDMALIAGRPPGDELRARLLRPDDLVVVRAPGRGARTPPLKRVDLAGHCWILREEGSATRRAAEAWLHRQRVTPARSMTFNGPDAVKRAVMAGLGISMMSRLTVADELKIGRLVQVPIGPALPACDVHVIDHPQKHHGAACSAMIAMLDAAFRGTR